MTSPPRAAQVAWLWLSVVVGGIGTAFPTRAQLAPERAGAESYETQRLNLALRAAGLEVDPAPEGKTVKYVRYERRQVLEPDDLLVPVLLPRFASTWTNMFHWLSEQSVVAREVLLRSGEPYRAALAEETMRNLRGMRIIALARVVPVKTGDPTKVGVFVYTRDRWSLRLQQDFVGTGANFSVAGELVEQNFLGRGKSLSVRGLLDPLRFSAGQTYYDPRVWQSEISAYETFDLIWNRGSGALEGGSGQLQVRRPFYNLAQTTAFDLVGSYSTQIARSARGTQVLGFDSTGQRTTCIPDGGDCIARVYDASALQLQAAGHYRVGLSYKQTYSLGAVYSDRRFAPNRETGLAPEQEALFRARVLPASRRDVYPYLRYRLDLPRYSTFNNLASFGLSETVQLGPRLDGQIGVPLRAFGASSDGLILHGRMSYVWSERDALVDLALEGFARLQDGRVVDQRAIARVRGATPSIDALYGRFVMQAYWDARHNDSQRSAVALGGDNGLRGYESQSFVVYGGRRFLANVEYRTRPWLVQSVHIGGVLFYDLGSAYERLSEVRVHHAVGAGVRVLFPQFNPMPFRLDLGFPLEQRGYALLLSYGGDQVVGLTPAEDLEAANSRLSGGL
jgi:hypothetical protein